MSTCLAWIVDFSDAQVLRSPELPSRLLLLRRPREEIIIGGSLLIALGVLMVTGIWGALMSVLQGVMLSVTLPL